jgi:hypothetical protein
MFIKSMSRLQATSPLRDTRSASIKVTSKAQADIRLPSPGLLLRSFYAARNRELWD